MIQPPFLKKGSVVGIVAPGRKILPAALHTALPLLEAWSVEVKLGKHIFSDRHSYLSGTDKERLHDLQEMLDDPEVHAVLCARGGYGTTRMLDQLNFSSFLKNPKWICGFSDVTALHLKLHKLGIQSIHGTMPILFPESTESVESLYRALTGKADSLKAEAHAKNKSGNCTGSLVGGNLSLLVDSLGTLSEVDTTGKILVLEEVDEFVYKVDRMLMQLKRAKKLQHLTGLVVGHMTDIKETELPFGESVEQLILNHTKDYSYPVAFNFPIGHQSPNLAWVQGATASLRVTEQGAMLSP